MGLDVLAPTFFELDFLGAGFFFELVGISI
jgi:hypothetical protein